MSHFSRWITATCFSFVSLTAAAETTMNVGGVSVHLPTSKEFMAATGIKPLDKPLHIKACVFDPVGANGDIINYAKDAVLEARKWNVFLEIKTFTNEMVAAESFKVGACDAAVMSTLRAKQFNFFAGSFDSVGAIANYDQLKTALRVIHTSPKVAPLMISGDYQVAGLAPIGALYVMVNDRKINSIEKAAGKKVAVLEWDKSQAQMVQKLGATPVASDITNFAGKFNNGQVDIIAAPALAFRPLELYRGLGANGAVFKLPLAMISGAIVFRRSKFINEIPDLDDKLQKIREFALGYMDQAFNLITNVEKDIDAKYWMNLSPEDTVKYFRMMREARITLMKEGVYDPRMMAILKKVRCKHEPSAAECTLNDE